ncbi:MAG TPA: class I SAM-dependent methyltransferase [Longimicrobium sp.]|nr:class I SAM-dependent methyltransferase [Longimicrobium sp.]
MPSLPCPGTVPSSDAAPIPRPDEAELYELAYYHGRERDHHLLRFLSALIDRHSPGGEVLDCACGTGEPSLWLAEWYPVTLADASESMVREARRKAARVGLGHVPVQTAEWAALPTAFDRRFAAVLCTGNALAQAVTCEQRRAALRGMRDVAAAGGMIYLDFREDYGEFPTERFTLSEVTGPLKWKEYELALMVYEGRFSAQIRRIREFLLVSPGRASVLWSATTRYLPFSRAEIRDDLVAVGFGEPVFHARPGAWPLTAVTATRSV